MSAELVAHIEDLLAGMSGVTFKKMFGGHGVFRDGVMFALVDGETVYLKGDDSTAADFEAEGCGPFIYSGKNKPVTMSYWRTPDRLLEDADEFVEWAERAHRIALASRKPRKATRK